jgi:hypothetical protein
LSEYSKISLKREFMEKIDQFIKDYPEHGYRSLAQFVEDAIRRRSDELQVFQLTPRFSHINTYEDHATIADKKMGQDIEGKRSPRLIDIYVRKSENNTLAFWCEYCDSAKCEHVKYALTIPKVQEILREKG